MSSKKRSAGEVRLPEDTRPTKRGGGENTVADHYSLRRNQTMEERNLSPILQLRTLNNWIKSVLIQSHVKQGDTALDLACGKGGNLFKWENAKIGYYVGVDIADGSIEDCRTRYNGKDFSFPARLLCGDGFEVDLDQVLAHDQNAPFDICSCQFALHYSWSSEARARRALANVSALLKPGGLFFGTMPNANVIIKRLRQAQGLKFGNNAYSIEFGEKHSDKKFTNPFGIEYMFNLNGAISDCPEWLVPFPVFKALAEEYDLELVFVKNFDDFVDEYMKKPEFNQLIGRLNKSDKTLSPEKWEVAYLYLAFALRKRGQPEHTRTKVRRDNGKMQLEKSDVVFIRS